MMSIQWNEDGLNELFGGIQKKFDDGVSLTFLCPPAVGQTAGQRRSLGQMSCRILAIRWEFNL